MINFNDVANFKKCPVLYQKRHKKERHKRLLLKEYLEYLNIKPIYSKQLIASCDAQYKEAIVHIPFLKKKVKSNRWQLILPVYSPKAIFMFKKEIEYIYYIMYKKGIVISEVRCAYVNPNPKLELFSISPINYFQTFKLGKNTIAKFDQLLQEMDEEYSPEFKASCYASNVCPLLKSCFNTPDTAQIYQKGLNEKQRLAAGPYQVSNQLVSEQPYMKAQYEAAQNGGVYINSTEIAAFLNQLQYPICYLDFEWGQKLNTQTRKIEDNVVCYSLHIETETVQHYAHFGFNEYELFTKLLREIPSVGSIIVYGASGETAQFKRCMNLFPAFKETIESILNRIIDISLPIHNGDFYDVRFKGKKSLKSVMNILDIKETSSITQGFEVVTLVDQLEEKYDETIVKEILDYNYNDTYALYLLKCRFEQLLNQK